MRVPFICWYAVPQCKNGLSWPMPRIRSKRLLGQSLHFLVHIGPTYFTFWNMEPTLLPRTFLISSSPTPKRTYITQPSTKNNCSVFKFQNASRLKVVVSVLLIPFFPSYIHMSHLLISSPVFCALKDQLTLVREIRAAVWDLKHFTRFLFLMFATVEFGSSMGKFDICLRV